MSGIKNADTRLHLPNLVFGRIKNPVSSLQVSGIRFQISRIDKLILCLKNPSVIMKRLSALLTPDTRHLDFAGLVALARRPNPIPSRTRPLNSSAPMVLCLKTWESRSLPGLQNACVFSTSVDFDIARVSPCNIGKLPYYSP